MNAKKCKRLRKIIPYWNEVEYNTVTTHDHIVTMIPLVVRQLVNPITRTVSCGRSVYQQNKGLQT